MAADKRLAMSLFIALVLHLLLFGLVGAPRKSFLPAARPLIVQWTNKLSAPPRPKTAEAKSAVQGDALSKRSGEARRDERRARSAPSPSAEDQPAVYATPAIADPVGRQPPAAAELMESARAIVRQMVREPARHQAEKAMADDRPFLPGLDRVLRNPRAGDERLAGGLIRVTTASGRIYCLRPPPDAARDGPVALVSIPTNCP